MSRFFTKPVMEESTTKALLDNLAGEVARLTADYRRRMFWYRVRMLFAGALAWFLLFVFYVGAMDVFGVARN